MRQQISLRFCLHNAAAPTQHVREVGRETIEQNTNGIHVDIRESGLACIQYESYMATWFRYMYTIQPVIKDLLNDRFHVFGL